MISQYQPENYLNCLGYLDIYNLNNWCLLFKTTNTAHDSCTFRVFCNIKQKIKYLDNKTDYFYLDKATST